MKRAEKQFPVPTNRSESEVLKPFEDQELVARTRRNIAVVLAIGGVVIAGADIIHDREIGPVGLGGAAVTTAAAVSISRSNGERNELFEQAQQAFDAQRAAPTDLPNLPES